MFEVLDVLAGGGDGGFSCTLKALHEGLRIKALQSLIKNLNYFNCKVLEFCGHQNLALDPDSPKNLGTDPDLQHWFIITSTQYGSSYIGEELQQRILDNANPSLI